MHDRHIIIGHRVPGGVTRITTKLNSDLPGESIADDYSSNRRKL